MRFVFWETEEEMAAKQACRAAARTEIAAARMRVALRDLALLESKYSAEQPRLPAGQPGGGQWTDGSGAFMPVGLSQVYKPVGNAKIPSTGYNPLDPARLNGPLSPVEGQKIAGALTAIDSGSPSLQKGTNPHPYKNLPDFATGAVLPPSAAGYTTYYVGPGDDNRRLVIDNGSDNIYYTNNHYKSFRPVIAPHFRSAKAYKFCGAPFGNGYEDA